MSDDERVRDQAKAQLESICLMLKRLEHAQDCNFRADITGEEGCKLTDQEIIEGLQCCYTEGQKATEEQREEYHDEEKARQAIAEDPLEISVRSDWHTPGDKDLRKPSEYLILLCTGGPAVRIIGDLNEHQEPESARLQFQDWFTPWEPLLPLEDGEHEALLTYAQQFYFGE
jgi:hypothetical protein